jgi:hypothetical protein
VEDRNALFVAVDKGDAHARDRLFLTLYAAPRQFAKRESWRGGAAASLSATTAAKSASAGTADRGRRT